MVRRDVEVRFKLTSVTMIRASNFPVLMLISLYERRQYSDTSFMETLGDYAEHYLGTLPRKLKTASKSRLLWRVLQSNEQLDLTTLPRDTTLILCLNLSVK